MTAGGDATHAVVKAAMESGSYESVLGDREAVRNTYREVIVYEQSAVYPEFVVLYRREYDKATAEGDNPDKTVPVVDGVLMSSGSQKSQPPADARAQPMVADMTAYDVVSNTT